MEVHHHAHNPAEPHHKKNWKSYFWEFLMLFLAVFCGFLAEYQLEHTIEHQREKEYAIALYDELITDRKTLSLKAKPILAIGSENPRMYQCSRVFALRGFDLRFFKPLTDPLSLLFLNYLW